MTKTAILIFFYFNFFTYLIVAAKFHQQSDNAANLIVPIDVKVKTADTFLDDQNDQTVPDPVEEGHHIFTPQQHHFSRYRQDSQGSQNVVSTMVAPDQHGTSILRQQKDAIVADEIFSARGNVAENLPLQQNNKGIIWQIHVHLTHSEVNEKRYNQVGSFSLQKKKTLIRLYI